MKYFCAGDRRRAVVRDSATFNGIDYLEVTDMQQTLEVHFLNTNAIGTLAATNFLIEGGERIKNIFVKGMEIITASPGGYCKVSVNTPGDFSTYTLRLITGEKNPDPPENFDRIFSSVDFSFKVTCPNDFDCKQTTVCPVEEKPRPEINYLAKDYASFRQLMLDRMALLIPGWTERHAADIGIALVEMLAYVGDHLSYEQDAVATEAYLGTARRRISVRRHARLVDYRMHDGCNARAWVHLQAGEGGNGNTILGPKNGGPGTLLLTNTNVPPSEFSGMESEKAMAAGAIPFETMHGVVVYETHNLINFYTWGDEQCCLPKGATSATLLDGDGVNENSRLFLRAGDVLIFEELKSPTTGKEVDADPSHRQAVRLTKVDPEAEEVIAEDGKITRSRTSDLEDKLFNKRYVTIEWNSEDALPFPFCISAMIDDEDGTSHVESGMSVALGNIVLADQGTRLPVEQIIVPSISTSGTVSTGGIDSGCGCAQKNVSTDVRQQSVMRFRSVLKNGPLTFAAPYPAGTSASAAMKPLPRDAMPEIRLTDNSRTWTPMHDLLASGEFDGNFVVETESNGVSTLRFGDDINGMAPIAGTTFDVKYRVGNGSAGNVGAGAICHIVGVDLGVTSVRNPLPATGGAEPESIEEVRQKAPYAFRIQERAVTEDDYAAIAQRDPSIQRAAATFRWTGSWHTAFLTVDRLGGKEVDPAFHTALEQRMERYRMAGYDLEVDSPRYVSLEIAMEVCTKPDHFRSDVKQALLDALSNRDLPGGGRGMFHPDNFTFGQPVYLSKIYAIVQAIEGVASVRITKFCRQGSTDSTAMENGKMELNRLEIARLDNDPNYPEHGILTLMMKGGK